MKTDNGPYRYGPLSVKQGLGGVWRDEVPSHLNEIWLTK